MEDRQLTSRFWLHEFPCWERATIQDVARLQVTAARVLQPIRNRWGKVIPTSWMWWADECDPRTGAHSFGGSVDFVTPRADMWKVFQWGATYLLPSGYIGRWIYEPERVDGEGNVIQGEHIHMAPREDMIALNGRGDIQALRETDDGQEVVFAYYDGTRGTMMDPYTMEPLVITAKRSGFSLWWAAALAGAWALNIAGQASGGIRLRRS